MNERCKMCGRELSAPEAVHQDSCDKCVSVFAAGAMAQREADIEIAESRVLLDECDKIGKDDIGSIEARAIAAEIRATPEVKP